MSFSDLPPQEPLVLPGGPEYAARVFELSKRTATQIPNVMDIAFGPDYWQKLDVFLPPQGGRNLPTLLFVHGGAWSKGYKEWVSFLAPTVIDLPALFIAVSHRKVPAARFPAPAEDCVSAVAWAYEHVEIFGGSRERLFLGGYSSGGHLAALVALRRDWAEARGLPTDVVKGSFLISAPLNLHLDVARGRRADLIRQFLGRDDMDRDASPIDHIAGASIPFLLCYGTDDLPEVIANNREIADLLQRRGWPVKEVVVEGGDHFTTSLACANPESEWAVAARRIMASATGTRPTRDSRSP